MTQSQEVSSILNRITQDSSQISQSTKVSSVRLRRPPPKSPRAPTKISLQVPIRSSSDGVAVYFDTQWEPVALCLNSILDSSGRGFFEGAFHGIERLCRDSQNFKTMNDRLVTRLDAFAQLMSDRLRPPVTAAALLGLTGFLQRVSLLLSSVFSPFEHAFLFPNTMGKLVLERLKIAVDRNPEAVTGVYSAVVTLIDEVRRTWIEQDSVTAVVPPEFRQLSELLELFDHPDQFEAAILSSTERFYSNFTIDSTSPSPFLMRVKSVLDKEQTIMNAFPKSIARIAIAEARVGLYVRTLTREMATFIASLMNDKQYDGLKILCGLVFASNDSELEALFIKSWGADTTTRVLSAFELTGTNNIIEELLTIHSSISDCRQSLHPQTSTLILRVFRQALNSQASRAAFLLAQYCHYKIHSSPQDFVTKCDKVLLLFRVLTSMDGFVQHHRQFLALRLCRIPSATALGSESEFLRHIAAICGDDEVHHMHRMIEDYNTSAEITKEFPSPNPPPAFSFILMTHDEWPSFPAVALRLPPEILDVQERFAAFFKQRQPGKKLGWQPALDEVVFSVNGRGVKGSAIYFLFLKAVLAGERFEPAGVSAADAKEMGQVLVKQGILRRVGEGFAVTKERAPNKGGKRPLAMLPLPSAISPKALAEQTMEDVAFSRRMKVQAALVLVMKRLRIAEVEVLFGEAVKVVHFVMTKKDFDVGLAECIEKCFLARNEEDGMITFSPD